MKLNKRFYRRALFILMATAFITGCAPRFEREAEETRAAYRGAAMQQALQNAHEAAFGPQQSHHHQAR